MGHPIKYRLLKPSKRVIRNRRMPLFRHQAFLARQLCKLSHSISKGSYPTLENSYAVHQHTLSEGKFQMHQQNRCAHLLSRSDSLHKIYRSLHRHHRPRVYHGSHLLRLQHQWLIQLIPDDRPCHLLDHQMMFRRIPDRTKS